MSELITVPTFTFRQGDVFGNIERPIQVSFYSGTIILQQEGEFEKDEEIRISPDFIEKLFKEIKRQKSEAYHFLKLHQGQ